MGYPYKEQYVSNALLVKVHHSCQAGWWNKQYCSSNIKFIVEEISQKLRK